MKNKKKRFSFRVLGPICLEAIAREFHICIELLASFYQNVEAEVECVRIEPTYISSSRCETQTSLLMQNVPLLSSLSRPDPFSPVANYVPFTPK